MISNKLLKCLDRSLRDICDNKPDLGGKFVIFGGDFRQILPVVVKGNRGQIVNSCVKHNKIWERVRKFTLRENLRADPRAKLFANYLLQIGEDRIPLCSNSAPWITPLHPDIISPYLAGENNILRLIHKLFGLELTENTVLTIAQNVILCPTNVTVMEINNIIVRSILKGKLKTYHSSRKRNGDSGPCLTHVQHELNMGGRDPCWTWVGHGRS